MLASCAPSRAPQSALLAPQAASEAHAVVERVIDGDTITANLDGQTVTIRLLGIDTPETPGGPRPAECYGSEASELARALLPAGTSVRLTRDVETRDAYGRLLAYVHRTDDNLFINQVMVELGAASVKFYSPNVAARDDFRRAAASARKASQGYWSACGAPDIVLDESGS